MYSVGLCSVSLWSDYMYHTQNTQREAPEVDDRTCKPVVGLRHLKPEDTCPAAEQLFGMCDICIHDTVFELCLLEKERRTNKAELIE